MELHVRHNGAGAVTSVGVDVASVGTNSLANESPKNFVTKIRNISPTESCEENTTTRLGHIVTNKPNHSQIRYGTCGRKLSREYKGRDSFFTFQALEFSLNANVHAVFHRRRCHDHFLRILLEWLNAQ
jgi:hypothetical protein